MSPKSANSFTRKKGRAKLPEFDALAKQKIAIGLPDDVIHNPSKLTMAKLGTIHEFGSSDGRIPARSFLRSFLNSRRSDIKRAITMGARNVVNGKPVLNELNKLALWAQGTVQEQIVDVDDPPNKPATIKRKGSANPLIDTGAMRQAVVGQVEGDV